MRAITMRGYASRCVFEVNPPGIFQTLRKGEVMSKILASALAVGIIIAGMATAQTMPVSRFESIKSVQTVLVADVISNDCQNPDGRCAPRVGHRRAYSVARNFQPDFPYMPSRFNLSGYDAGEGQYCSFGSYVACAYAGTYCWRRCH
jgi:hypothetical protein